MLVFTIICYNYHNRGVYMESINFKNGILIHESKAYNLNHLFFQDFSEFIISTPNNDFNKYKILIYFDNLNFKAENVDIDELITGRLVKKMDKIYREIPNSICVIPTISKKEFNEINEENDNKPYNKLLKDLDKVVTYAYWSIKNNLIFEDTMNVDPQIGIIRQSEEDIKFIWWLELQGNKKYKQVEIASPNKKEIIEDNTTLENTPITQTTEVKSPPSRRQAMKRTRKPKGDGIHSTGYSNMAFIVLVLTISMLMGIGLAVLILK